MIIPVPIEAQNLQGFPNVMIDPSLTVAQAESFIFEELQGWNAIDLAPLAVPREPGQVRLLYTTAGRPDFHSDRISAVHGSLYYKVYQQTCEERLRELPQFDPTAAAAGGNREVAILQSFLALLIQHVNHKDVSESSRISRMFDAAESMAEYISTRRGSGESSPFLQDFSTLVEESKEITDLDSLVQKTDLFLARWGLGLK